MSTVDKDVDPDITILLAACGGCGINLAGRFSNIKENLIIKELDTSRGNSKFNDKLIIVGDGHGSGSNRAMHARDIESAIPQIDHLFAEKPDVVIVPFSLSGGSGNVIATYLIKEAARQKIIPIAIAIVDTSSSIEAKNTYNALKTLSAVAKQAEIGLPMLIASNDLGTRATVDDAIINNVGAIVKILRRNVTEVDKRDRLNWIDPHKLVGTAPGLKIMSFTSDNSLGDSSVLIGAESKEMNDSVLVVQRQEDFAKDHVLPLTRLKKIGVLQSDGSRLVGRVSSDISQINLIIDNAEQMANTTKAQKHETIDRLGGDTNGDIFF